ncbi:uncharacterized protein PHALS_02360 [Plasmopara halstedii]|uniref:Uncharacterized protein n=1 Tax=Plasmopara halstedii TaxID=4781 RepID=A0A0P1AWP8_PLAHL|nr:uncharacterized protein PHALS_02360 [Plasmopara halstedii]CEG46034.1 hypothetical protein PHALS_02360 [Plasmopara halstedii]|eukprot:XP_024582403.1 hypothetical protein PHALS_02360 [Plasmopara halstedii]
MDRDTIVAFTADRGISTSYDVTIGIRPDCPLALAFFILAAGVLYELIASNNQLRASFASSHASDSLAPLHTPSLRAAYASVTLLLLLPYGSALLQITTCRYKSATVILLAFNHFVSPKFS